MFKKLIILLFCSSALLANDLAPEPNPRSLETTEETPKWDHFSYAAIGFFSAGVGQRYNYGYCGIDYSLNVFSMIFINALWADVNVLGYLVPKDLKQRPYLGIGGMYGFGTKDTGSAWALRIPENYYVGSKAFAGCEFKTDSGKIHFLELGGLFYPTPSVKIRYGFSF